MKMSDLREKKGPIIGAPKGSQKDSRLSPGTDDPSKYMRGGEWEAYREPQGVSSDAGKIAGGTKKGTTKTKNKKISEEEFDYLDEWIGPFKASIPVFNKNVDGFRDLVDELRKKYKISIGYMQHKNRVIYKIFPMMLAGPFVNVRRFTNELFSFLEKHSRSAINRNYYDEYAKDFQEKLKELAIKTAAGRSDEYKQVVSNLRSMSEGLQTGGPKVSGDLVPRDPHATTIAMVKDTLHPNIKKSPKLAGSEAPTKQVKKQIKKSYDNRPGNISDIRESLDKKINQIVNEAIPRVVPQDYSADYDLRDDRDQETIGVAKVTHGVIELLSVRNDILEDFNGHIMSRLLSTIVRDADAANANLAIALDDPSDLQHKRFLERFGFRAVGLDIMKRNAGSVTPPSVPSARL